MPENLFFKPCASASSAGCNSLYPNLSESAVPAKLSESQMGTLPENTRNEKISIEDCLHLHFSRRLTLAIAVFNSAFLTPALFASDTSLAEKPAEFVDLRRPNCLEVHGIAFADDDKLVALVEPQSIADLFGNNHQSSGRKLRKPS